MLFALLCTDKPGALQLRLDTRPDHLAYLNELNAKARFSATTASRPAAW